jgi:uncharacterized DUF497 family protein
VATIIATKFIFDPTKDRANFEKHGLSLSAAKSLDWDHALSWVDDRKDYGEVRCISLVPMKQWLYLVVYVDSKVNRRIISLRKANNREIGRYEKETD